MVPREQKHVTNTVRDSPRAIILLLRLSGPSSGNRDSTYARTPNSLKGGREG